MPTPAVFLDDLVYAWVTECYLRDHMAKRTLLFNDLLAQHLTIYGPAASEH